MVIDSRAIAPGDLFFALPGERVDGGAFAADALRAGAWGVVAAPAWAREAAALAEDGAVLAAEHPVASLGALARAWRRDLAAHVIAITGSVGKTSTKDLTAALIAPHRTVASSRANFNTEIGLPLELLAAPPGTEVLVLELAMRGFGQIAELTAICEPDVGVITNVGPVHLEQMGSLEGVARAKAELLAGLRDGAVAVVPSDEPLLEPYLRPELDVVTFGPGGDVHFEGASLRGGPVPDAVPEHHVVVAGADRFELDLPFDSRHNLRNTLAAAAAARAVGVRPSGRVDVRFGALRGRARGARARRHRRQRLLQRQPALHARRPGRSCHAGPRRTARRGARRHARARTGRARAPPRDRRLRGVGGRGRADRGRAAGRGDARRVRRREARRARRGGRRGAGERAGRRPGDVVLVKASRGDRARGRGRGARRGRGG